MLSKYNIFIGVWVCICLIMFGVVIYRDYKSKANNVAVTFETRIDTMKVDVLYDRGWIQLNDTLILRAEAKVVSNPDNFNNWHNGLIYSVSPYVGIIGHMPLPYTLWKEANNDTLYVEKDNFKLKFLLPKSLK